MAANAAGFVIDAIGIAVALSLVFKEKVPDQAKTNVQIILGSGHDDAGGASPHIALWDKCEQDVSINSFLQGAR